MSNNLSALEEFDAQRKIQFPHLLSSAVDLRSKKNTAYLVLARKERDLLLISPSGFGESAVIAGLSEKNIEHFMKGAPREHKENLLSVVSNNLLMEDAWEIAKSMDEDSGSGQTQHQDRVKKVFQYIKDNRAMLQF